MKTSTLTGADLNRAVAMALGQTLVFCTNPGYYGQAPVPARWTVYWAEFDDYTEIPNYATDITAAWPIIAKHQIDLEFNPNGIETGCAACVGRYGNVEFVEMVDDDPLVAAMRCFVASVLGDEVELP